MNKYKVERILKENYTDEDWQKYFDFRTKCSDLEKVKFHFETWEKLKEASIAFLERGDGIYTVNKNSEKAGYFFLDKRQSEKPDLKHVFMIHYFIDKEIDDELFTLLLKNYLDLDTDHGFLVIQSKNGEHDHLGEKINGEIGTTQIHYELRKENVNHDVIDNWIETYSAKFSNLKMKFYEAIPEELIDEYCKVFTELLLDMPANSAILDFNIKPEKFIAGEERGRKENQISYRYLVFNEDDKLIAKTNIAINKNKPQTMHQYMTGVIKEYRELGIGKWMKGTMYKKIEKDFPEMEVIRTETHPENHGSKSISLQMGYQQTSTLKEFKVSREKVEAFMKK